MRYKTFWKIIQNFSPIVQWNMILIGKIPLSCINWVLGALRHPQPSWAAFTSSRPVSCAGSASREKFLHGMYYIIEFGGMGQYLYGRHSPSQLCREDPAPRNKNKLFNQLGSGLSIQPCAYALPTQIDTNRKGKPVQTAGGSVLRCVIFPGFKHMYLKICIEAE
jgi:hypothetical protein